MQFSRVIHTQDVTEKSLKGDSKMLINSLNPRPHRSEDTLKTTRATSWGLFLLYFVITSSIQQIKKIYDNHEANQSHEINKLTTLT